MLNSEKSVQKYLKLLGHTNKVSVQHLKQEAVFQNKGA
jgi:hypothetical protein